MTLGDEQQMITTNLDGAHLAPLTMAQLRAGFYDTDVELQNSGRDQLRVSQAGERSSGGEGQASAPTPSRADLEADRDRARG
jgi:hypothetical protein